MDNELKMMIDQDPERASGAHYLLQEKGSCNGSGGGGDNDAEMKNHKPETKNRRKTSKR